MATEGPRETKVLLEGASRERAAMFSPNGRWMAYASDESGRFEVYVTPFPGPGPRTPVSTDGGVEPLWSRDGRELYYRENDRLMAADFRGAADTIGRPRVLFEGRFEKTAGMGGDTANYDVAPDGRFVMVRRKHLQAPTTIQVVLNWPALLPSAAR
jgi:Tol biopolymer transport system component